MQGQPPSPGAHSPPLTAPTLRAAASLAPRARSAARSAAASVRRCAGGRGEAAWTAGGVDRGRCGAASTPGARGRAAVCGAAMPANSWLQTPPAPATRRGAQGPLTRRPNQPGPSLADSASPSRSAASATLSRTRLPTPRSPPSCGRDGQVGKRGGLEDDAQRARLLRGNTNEEAPMPPSRSFQAARSPARSRSAPRGSGGSRRRWRQRSRRRPARARPCSAGASTRPRPWASCAGRVRAQVGDRWAGRGVSATRQPCIRRMHAAGGHTSF